MRREKEKKKGLISGNMEGFPLSQRLPPPTPPPATNQGFSLTVTSCRAHRTLCPIQQKTGGEVDWDWMRRGHRDGCLSSTAGLGKLVPVKKIGGSAISREAGQVKSTPQLCSVRRTNNRDVETMMRYSGTGLASRSDGCWWAEAIGQGVHGRLRRWESGEKECGTRSNRPGREPSSGTRNRAAIHTPACGAGSVKSRVNLPREGNLLAASF